MAKAAEERLVEDHYRKLEEEFDIEFCSPSEVKRALTAYVRSPHPYQHFMVVGEPGGGKSAIVFQVAKQEDCVVVEVRVSTADEGTLNGYPVPSPSCPGAVELCIVKHLRDQFEAAVKAGKRIIVFFDELNRGKKNLINATFNIIDNRLWGSYQLPANTLFVVAVNPASETRNVIDIIKGEDALNRRYMIVGLKPDALSLLEYADKSEGFHWLIKDYVKDRPKAIMSIDKMLLGKKYMCPAILDGIARRFTYLESVGVDLMNLRNYPDELRLLYAAGGKSEGMAILDYISDKKRHITPSSILNSYEKVKAHVKGRTSLDGNKEETLDHSELYKVARHVADHVAELKIDFSKEKVQGENLSEFMNDLTDEILDGFVKTLRTKLGGDADAYLEQMSTALCHNENLVSALTKITLIKRKGVRELGT